ncbi:MAG: hypothetical protein Q8L48_27205 [Archangium sp.]|nr:hypothetical protein [Archangium sp.]
MKQLEQLAKQQFGVVSREQVLKALKHRSSIAWKVKNGELTRAHERAYLLRGVPRTWEQRATEGVFIGGPQSAISHQSAAWLHSLDGFERPKVIDVSVGRNRPRPREGLAFHRSRIGNGSAVIKRGLDVTSVQRTIVDLAGVLAPEALETALDSAHRKHPEFMTWLTEYIKRLSVQATPGLSSLLELIKLRSDGVTDSALEVKVLRKLRDAGLLAHLTQYEVYDLNGDYVMRLDFCWPHLKVALHVDGFRWHSQRERFDRDARQRSRLSALGWRTVTVTFNTFADGSWLNDLRALLNPQSELALQ